MSDKSYDHAAKRSADTQIEKDHDPYTAMHFTIKRGRNSCDRSATMRAKTVEAIATKVDGYGIVIKSSRKVVDDAFYPAGLKQEVAK